MRHRKFRMKNERAYLFVIPSAAIIASIFVGSAILAQDTASDIVSSALPVQKSQNGTDDTSTAYKNKPIASVTTPAQVSINTLISYEPDNLASPQINDTGTPNNALSWVCEYEMLPAPVLGTEVTFPADKMSAIFQVVGAGQGKKAVSHARSSVQACANRDGRGGIYVWSSPIIGTEGFTGYYQVGGKQVYSSVWQRGDVILSVSGASLDKVKALVGQYDKEIQGILEGVCLSLDVASNDAERSPYYSPESYTGWNKGRKVELSTRKTGLHPGMLSSAEGVSGNGLPLGKVRRKLGYEETITVPSWSLVTPPEEPLPPFEGSLPKPVSEPGLVPESPQKRPTSVIIPERIKDLEGPGCGWAFTGQSSPLWDDAREKARANDEASKAQKELQADYKAYLAEKAEYLDAWTAYYDAVMTYRKYAKEVKAVDEQWEELNEKRQTYKALLDAYWKSVEVNEKFQKDQEVAQETYDENLLACLSQPDKPVPTETAPPVPEEEVTTPPDSTPTPPEPESTVPPEDKTEPEVPKLKCPPKRPSILDKEAPDILPVPDKPDFLLPDAWKNLVPVDAEVKEED